MLWLLLLTVVCCAQSTTVFNSNPKKNWAVLVAGSNGWYNYRHQSDVCHAYQILRRNGIPAENIITFMYDDIAHDSNNPFPGKIFNSPKKDFNVYEGVVIDYRGEDVNEKLFRRVLLGDQELKNSGKKVLESGPEDNVFIFFSDHGAGGLIAFPDDELHVSDLNETITKMHEQKRYHQMVIYIEACYSGSMFEEVLSDKINVFATTAANSHESSYAIFCNDPVVDTCLADEYSYKWMVDSEKHLKSGWTLNQQFRLVKSKTQQSHVMEYGDLGIANSPISEFQAHKTLLSEDKPNDDAITTEESLDEPEIVQRIPSTKAHLTVLTRRLLKAQSEEDHERAKKRLQRAIQLGTMVQETFEDIADHTRRFYQTTNGERNKAEQLRCFKKVFQVFKKKCFTIQQVPEVAPQLSHLHELCKAGYEEKSIIESIKEVCG